MRINENRTLELGPKDCRACTYTPGTAPTPIDCPSCEGTGNGPRGGRRTCRPCYGSGTRYDQEVRIPCPACKGEYESADTETLCDRIADDQWKKIVEWQVVRGADRLDRISQVIGISGALVTVADYGKAHEQDDEAVLSDAMRSVGTSVQAIHIVRKADMRLADRIIVLVSPNGYGVLPMWDSPAAEVAA